MLFPLFILLGHGGSTILLFRGAFLFFHHLCSVLLCFPSTLPPLLKPTANKSATEKMARAAAGTNINMVSSVIAFSPFLSPIVYHIPVALQNSRCQSNLLILRFLSYLPVFSSSFASIVAKKLLTLPPAW